MGIFHRIGKAVGFFQSAPVAIREALRIAWSEAPRRTTDLYTDTYHKTPMLDPLHLIASDVSSAPFSLYRKVEFVRDPDNATPIVDHALLTTLASPMPTHPEIDFYQFFYCTCIYYELIGDCFWGVDKAPGSGKVNGFYLIPPSWMLSTPTKGDPNFHIQPMGNTSHTGIPVPNDSVVWFKAPNLVNPYGRGRARAEAIADEIDTHEYSSKYAKNLFYNDAVPPIIVEMPGAGEPELKAFKEQWMQLYGGFLNSRKPAIVGKKDFKVHQIATNQKEMDFVESRKYLIQMANEHYAVPPEIRGNLQNSNRATIDSAFYLWTKTVVTKRLRLFESAINAQVVPLFDKSVVFKFDNIVPNDDEFALKMLTQGVQAGTVTRNEWRLGMGLPKDEARGDVYLMGLMTQEVSAFKKAELPSPPEEKPEEALPAPATVEEEEEEEESEEGEEEKSTSLSDVVKAIDAIVEKVNRDTIRKSEREARLVAIWKAFDKRANAVEPKFREAVRIIANTQNAKVSDAIRVALKKSTEEKTLNSAIKQAFSGLDEGVKVALTPAWLAGMTAGAEHAMDTISGKAFAPHEIKLEAVKNPWFSKYLEKYGLLKAKEINTTTYDVLRGTLDTSLAEGISQGEGTAKLIERLLLETEGVYANMTAGRAEVIARTESATSENYGIYATYKVEGVTKKTWLSTRDDRTREAHIEADGQTVGIDEKFLVGVEELDFPGDPSGSAGTVIQCRCTMLGEID